MRGRCGKGGSTRSIGRDRRSTGTRRGRGEYSLPTDLHKKLASARTARKILLVPDRSDFVL